MKTNLAARGIDVTKFPVYSTRAAAVSAPAVQGHVPVDDMLKAAIWSRH
jgi:hypothetical protein